MQDLCVSRTTFDWGVPVDFDLNHVVYVWIDALSNYITFLGYDPDGSSEEFRKYWPADIHLIGKDILRFHTLYWPILLMALDLELPERIFGHPWLLMNNDKMSKSKGNVIYADDLVEKFGVDAVRYYLIHEIPFSSDGNITYELLIERINGDLANILGNLVQRTISMVNQYFSGHIENSHVDDPKDEEIFTLMNELDAKVEAKMNSLEVSAAVDEVFTLLRASNKYIDETMPWVLAKDEEMKLRLETVLYNLLESIRICAVFLEPIIPDTSREILFQLQIENKSLSYQDNLIYEVGTPRPIFKRINKDSF